MSKHKIVIVGAGVIGRALGLILRELGDMDLDIYIGDIKKDRAYDVAHWITEDSEKKGEVEPFAMTSLDKDEVFKSILKGS